MTRRDGTTKPHANECNIFDKKSGGTQPFRRLFATAAELRSAGFQTCCVADFKVGMTSTVKQSAGLERQKKKGEPYNLAQRLKSFLECGGNPESFRGTPLGQLGPQSKRGVAARLCHRSPKPPLRHSCSSVSIRGFFAFCAFVAVKTVSRTGRRPKPFKKGLTLLWY